MATPSSTVICIADIHGQIEKLTSLWTQLQAEVGPEQFDSCEVVFLGDYVDRGTDSKATLEWLSTLRSRHPRQTHAFLAGNHDFSMAAFLGFIPELPETLQTLPDGSKFTLERTWINEVPRRRGEKEGWWKGPPEVLAAMHLQGRRWGGTGAGTDSIYSSKETFESYGVAHGDREGLLKAMPEGHKQFLQELKWVHETVIPSGGKFSRLIAVHAGLESHLPLQRQLEACRKKDYRRSHIECFSGRDNVLFPPVDLPADTLLVSGHHGFLFVKDQRLVIDEGGGLPHKPLCAMILPSMKLVRDQAKAYHAVPLTKHH